MLAPSSRRPIAFMRSDEQKNQANVYLVKNFVSFCASAHIPDLESEKQKTPPKIRGKRPSQRRVRRGHMTMRALTRITSCASGEKTTRRPPMWREKKNPLPASKISHPKSKIDVNPLCALRNNKNNVVFVSDLCGGIKYAFVALHAV